MITFTILLALALALLITAALIVLVSGTGFLLVFGDLIAFVAIIWLLVKLFKRRK